ncbi:MAG: hypothetical protein K2Q06_04725 [Parvularculaceae bacterium]|nr:hypothetical protein [Parvularculaceae bacterium]
MRGAGLLLLLLGFVLGTMWTVSVLPGVSLSDLWGQNSFTAALDAQGEAIARAFSGVAVGIVWALFGLTVALIWSAIGSVFRGGRSGGGKAHH